MAGSVENSSGRPANRRSLVMWGGAALLLLLPWAAMQFTNEVAWDAVDFATFGAMLVIACGSYEVAARLAKKPVHRAIAALVIAAAFLLVWVELAVGIFGD